MNSASNEKMKLKNQYGNMDEGAKNELESRYAIRLTKTNDEAVLDSILN